MTVSRLALAAAFGTTATAPAFAELDVWDLLSQIDVDERVTATTYEVIKTFPKGFESDLENTKVTGYAVPLWDGAQVREFMLVTDMGLCPFCGSGEHGGNLLVTLANPVDTFQEGARMTLEGTLSRVLDPETWQAAILEDARIVAQ